MQQFVQKCLIMWELSVSKLEWKIDFKICFLGLTMTQEGFFQALAN